MIYYSILKKEPSVAELWIKRGNNLWPIFDYKVEADQIRLISDPDISISEAITLDELIGYVQEEGDPVDLPYIVVDELTGKYLDIKDRFEHKLVFEICN